MDELYKKSLEIEKQLAMETDTFTARWKLSAIYGSIGNIRKKRGDLDGALESYEKSLHLRENLATEARKRQDLVKNIWVILKERKNLDGTEALFEELLQKCPVPMKGLDIFGSNRALAVGYNRIGNIRKQQNDLDGAIEMYEKALGILEQLAVDIPSAQSEDDMNRVQNKIADIKRELR